MTTKRKERNNDKNKSDNHYYNYEYSGKEIYKNGLKNLDTENLVSKLKENRNNLSSIRMFGDRFIAN